MKWEEALGKEINGELKGCKKVLTSWLARGQKAQNVRNHFHYANKTRKLLCEKT